MSKQNQDQTPTTSPFRLVNNPQSTEEWNERVFDTGLWIEANGSEMLKEEVRRRVWQEVADYAISRANDAKKELKKLKKEQQDER